MSPAEVEDAMELPSIYKQWLVQTFAVLAESFQNITGFNSLTESYSPVLAVPKRCISQHFPLKLL